MVKLQIEFALGTSLKYCLLVLLNRFLPASIIQQVPAKQRLPGQARVETEDG